MNFSVKSDIGRHRDLNEDSSLAKQYDNYEIYIVADGMGGHLAGEVASKLAIESIDEFLIDNFNKEANKEELIKQALIYANKKIYEKSESDPSMSNMGTTCDALLIYDDQAYIAHVGDSRVYLCRQNEMKQLTKDHSLLNDLIDSGSVSAEEAKYMKQKNIITRALGGDHKVKVDNIKINIEDEDVFLLCTDGLTNGVSDINIQEVIDMDISLNEKTDMLIYMSNASGGYDNSTVIIVEKR